MIPASDLGGVTPEATPPPPKQWWVSSCWLTDSDQFNEWMTEEDYELIIVVRNDNKYRVFLIIIAKLDTVDRDI